VVAAQRVVPLVNIMRALYEAQEARAPKPEVGFVPPDPSSDRVTEWGNAYPCLKVRDKGGGWTWMSAGQSARGEVK